MKGMKANSINLRHHIKKLIHSQLRLSSNTQSQSQPYITKPTTNSPLIQNPAPTSPNTVLPHAKHPFQHTAIRPLPPSVPHEPRTPLTPHPTHTSKHNTLIPRTLSPISIILRLTAYPSPPKGRNNPKTPGNRMTKHRRGQKKARSSLEARKSIQWCSVVARGEVLRSGLAYGGDTGEI